MLFLFALFLVGIPAAGYMMHRQGHSVGKADFLSGRPCNPPFFVYDGRGLRGMADAERARAYEAGYNGARQAQEERDRYHAIAAAHVSSALRPMKNVTPSLPALGGNKTPRLRP